MELFVCVWITQRSINFTIRDQYPIPNISEIYSWLQGKPWMIKTDMASGYNQIIVAPESRPILAFVTHLGLFQPKRMPFGPTNAPAHFST